MRRAHAVFEKTLARNGANIDLKIQSSVFIQFFYSSPGVRRARCPKAARQGRVPARANPAFPKRRLIRPEASTRKRER